MCVANCVFEMIDTSCGSDFFDDLLYFSRSGAVQELQSSLKSIPASQIPAFLSQKDDRGNTCLHFAAANGHLPIVTELLKSIEQISINSTNEGGNTPLHWACLNGHLGVVKELLKHGADTKVKNRGGRQPVDEAESQNKENCVLWLLALDMANEKADAQGDDYEEAEVKLTAGDVGQGEPQQIVLNAHAKPDYKRDARLARVMDSVKIDGLADLDDID